MELKALRTFVKVAEFRNISQAALSLGLTQSSVSRIIAALERDIGNPLFYRTGRGVTLTETGEAAFARARSILVNCEQLLADMRDFGQAPSGVVSLAMLPSLIRSIAGDLFEEVRRTHPRITLRVMEGLSGRIEEWLADGRADIALLSRYRKVRASREEILTASHLSLVGRRSAESARDTITFRQAARVPLVLPSNPNGLRAAVNAVARSLQVKLNVVAEADSFEAQKAIVNRQGCFMVLSPQTVDRELASGLFHSRIIVDPEVTRLVVMSTTTHRPLSRATRQVASIIRRLTCASGEPANA